MIQWRWSSAGLLAVLLFVGSSVSAQEAEPDAKTEQKKTDYYELMQTFVEIFDQIDRNYVKDVDSRKVLEAGIRGMLEELDPYSSYISPDEISKFSQDIEQQFGGIGIQVAVDEKTKRLTVMTPLPGTPAYKAGVRAGDIIEEIEGKSTKGFTLDEAIKLLKGKVGESVKIGIRHLGSDKIEQLDVMREMISVSTVLGDHYRDNGTWEFMLDKEKKIGYIRLNSFSRRSGEEMRDALEELKKEGMKSLVLDLRYNPGGLLSQAVEIADMFIEEGRIVSTEGRNSPERVWTAKKPGTYSGFPMAVLVNHYSASASEILSACLQDHNRAVVIGERSWGKGSVQNVIEIENGNSALKLTTAGYLRPNGKNIHRFPESKPEDEWGVSPNDGYEVKQTAKEMQDYLDYRRTRDVLKAGGPEKSEYVDTQLSKALEYLAKEPGGEKPAAPPAEEKKAAQATPKKPLTPVEAANRLGLLRVIPTQTL